MSKRTVVEWSPHDSSLFAVGADNLRLFETFSADSADAAAAAMTTQRKRSFRVVRINAKVAQLKCLQWYPFEAKPLLIAAGTGSGKVLLSDFQDPRARVVREFLPKYSRPCHAVAWNQVVPHQLAAGFEKVRSDYCTLVWDLNTASAASSGAAQAPAGGATATNLAHSGSSGNLEAEDGRKGAGGGGVSVGVGAGGAVASAKPVHELSNSEATMALSWVPLQPTCLATGTGFKWLRVYDLRAKGASPMSVVAHNKAVLGVAFDQHRPHLLATYSDAPQEPVKVWDLRQLESASGPLLSLHQSSKNLAQVSWCPSKPGILVTASTDEKWVSLWDVTKFDRDESQGGGASALKKPFRRRYTSEPLTSFSWQHVATASRSQRASATDTRNQITAAAFPNRLLTASVSGEIEDISVHDVMPLALSAHGAVTFSCGKLLFGGSASGDSGLGTAAMSQLTLETHDDDGGGHARRDEDISSQMYRLAKQGYSVALAKNLKLFGERSPGSRQLRNLWLWVDQVEALRRIRASRVAQWRSASNSSGMGGNAVNIVTSGPLRGWPIDPNVLVSVGVKNLLLTAGESPPGVSSDDAAVTDADSETPPTIVSTVKTDQVLGCQYFEGLGRRLALLACNWDPDNGQGGGRNSASTAGGPGLDNASGRHMHRSNSGVWSAHKPPYDDSAQFANRSWSDSSRHELPNLLKQCEAEGDYARAAALAVFHGDLNAAVALLQKGAAWLNQAQHLHVASSSPYSSDVLQLVAMAVAGYSASTASSGGLSLWLTMTQQLLKRSEIVTQSQPRYFHAMLSFLCATSALSSASGMASMSSGRSNQQPPRRPSSRRQWGSVDGLSVFTGAKPASAAAYAAILSDTTLPLSDRLAFACRFLQADDLWAFVTRHEAESERFGRLEGLMLSGLHTGGIRLLQRYLDTTGDIQTLALLAARLPSAHVSATPPLDKWIQLYQDLLNQWQLFHERARFDVGRSQLEDLLNSFASFARDSDAEDLQAELSAPSTLSVPPQLFVRCNFCNASLSLASLLRLGGSHSSWLNRAKPKLTCCPTCRKPLPQCALCLLPFGSLNPYFELAHRRSQHTAEAASALVGGAVGDSVLKEPKGGKSEYENLAQLSSIPFVEWFAWCQSCKHGGHAHHLADWFKAHAVCPVTDCDCSCQHLDLPLVQSDKQTEKQKELIAQQRESAAAAQRASAASGKKKKQQQQQQQQLRHKQQDAPASARGGTKSFLQQQASAQGGPHHFSASTTLGANPSYRGFSSSTVLRPSGSASGYPPPFSLSGSGSGSGTSSGSGNVGSGAGNVGSGAGNDGNASMGLSLGNKLDQLEKDKSSYKYM